MGNGGRREGELGGGGGGGYLFSAPEHEDVRVERNEIGTSDTCATMNYPGTTF